MRRWSTLVAVLVLVLLGGAGTALAEPPFRVPERITDRVGALDGAGDQRVRQAIEELRVDGTDLWVVYVDSFDGADGQTWADDTATRSQFANNDVLLAVAIGDRAYGVSFADDYPLPESRTDPILTDDVEPRLGAGDWAGAAVALADGLRTGGSGGSNGGRRRRRDGVRRGRWRGGGRGRGLPADPAQAPARPRRWCPTPRRPHRPSATSSAT